MLRSDSDFEGKTAWVIGAAGTLGSAIATALAAAGAQVVLSSRRRAALRTVADGFPQSGVDAEVMPMDIESDASVTRAARIVRHRCRLIDRLENYTGSPT